MGSISVQIWATACSSVIQMGGEVVDALWVLATPPQHDAEMKQSMKDGAMVHEDLKKDL